MFSYRKPSGKSQGIQQLMAGGGIMNNLSGMFDNVDSQVGQIASQVGTPPQARYVIRIA